MIQPHLLLLVMIFLSSFSTTHLGGSFYLTWRQRNGWWNSWIMRMLRWPRMPFFVFRGFSSAPSMLAFFRLNARWPPPIHKHFAVVVSDIVVWKSWSCLLCHYLRVILQTTKNIRVLFPSELFIYVQNKSMFSFAL